MRARNIKPGICENEILGCADPLLTLLFERLWMMADREGRLEDRPLRIKAQAFPYRDGLDIEPLLEWLESKEFILRYEVGSARYIQVLQFKKHQKPHKNEQPSTIPPPSGMPRQLSETAKASTENNQGSAMDALIPDSGLLIADSGLRIPERAPDPIPEEPPNPEAAAKAEREMRRCGEYAVTLTQAGMKVTSMDPRLTKWVQEGYLLNMVLDALARAKTTLGQETGINAGYVDKILRDTKQGGSAVTNVSPYKPRPFPKPDPNKICVPSPRSRLQS